MSLVIAIGFSILVFILAYNIACVLSPPYFIEESGEKHPTMPIGQVMIAGLFSGILGIIFLIIVYKRFIKRKSKTS